MRKLLRRLFGLGLLAGVGVAIWKALESQRVPSSIEWDTQPIPYPPVPRQGATGTQPTAKPAAAKTDPWVKPVRGKCPDTHPIKAKQSTKIFHVPGGALYERTVPDRCYVDAAAAKADGYRQAKR